MRKETVLFISLSASSPDPMHKQVTDQVKQAIAVGDIVAGEQLPSIRELAKALGISVITVKRSYLDLEAQGLIIARPGLGSFVAEVDRGRLRSEKLSELRATLTRVLAEGEKFGVTAADVVRLIQEIEES